jgi:hypothetical protein
MYHAVERTGTRIGWEVNATMLNVALPEKIGNQVSSSVHIFPASGRQA